MSRRGLIENSVAILLFGLAAFGLVLIFFYLYPRKIVDADTPQTTKSTYSVGEEVFVKGHTKIFVTGSDTNDVRLQCGSAQYFIKQISLEVRPLDIDYPEFSLGVIPDGVVTSPPSCRFITYTTYRVPFFLGMERNYTHTFTTNEFNIVRR